MDEVENWRRWGGWREEQLWEPHGVLAVVDTHWLGTEPAPILEGEPVLWSASPDGKTVVVTAEAEHGLFVDGESIDGTVALRVDTTADPQTVAAPDYGILLVPIERDGRAALRVHSAKSPTRAAFVGIERFDYDPGWVLEAKWTPFDQPRAENVLHTDGVIRSLDFSGTVEFESADGATHSFRAGATGTGALFVVFADATTAQSELPFRFLPVETAEDGSVRLDFNRAHLPQCAFSDHYVCATPPRGNTLGLPVRAGEIAVRTR